MAEKIVSPGVFTNEVDQSFLPAGVQAIGAAVIGPTRKGPAGIPTIVSSYSEYVQKFGGKFTSGSGASENSYKYLLISYWRSIDKKILFSFLILFFLFKNSCFVK